MESTIEAKAPDTKLNKDGKKLIFRGLVVRPLLQLGILWGVAGGTWTALWVYMAIMWGLQVVHAVVLERKNPELMNHRARMGKNTKGFDKVFLAFYFVGAISLFVVTALDAGKHGWTTVPVWGQGIGVVMYVIGFVWIEWAMTVNKHFEATVRIQEDRNHQVCTTGPYQYMRHPGYLGMIVALTGVPLVLGSLWGVAAAGVIALILVVRLVLEDRTLHQELDGYVDYAEQVRYRLVPGVF